MLEDGFKISGFDASAVPFSNTVGKLSFIKPDKSYKNFDRLSPIIFEGLSITYSCYKLIEQSCTCKIYGKMQI
jgi:hypothetical protein